MRNINNLRAIWNAKTPACLILLILCLNSQGVPIDVQSGKSLIGLGFSRFFIANSYV